MSTIAPDFPSMAQLGSASSKRGVQVRLESDGRSYSNETHCKLANKSKTNDDTRPSSAHRNQSQCTSLIKNKRQSSSHNQSHSNTNSNVSNQFAGSSPLERFITILLPFVFVFLLPTIKLSQPSERTLDECSRTRCAEYSQQSSLLEAGHLFGPTSGATSDLLLALIRFPFDKIRLQTAGLVLAADGKEIIGSKSDLQEEETHMMLLAPAEHRSGGGYNGLGGGQGAPTNYHYGSGNGGESGAHLGSGSDAHAQAAALGDYGPDQADQPSVAASGSGASGGQGESTVVAESASSAGSQLQTRSDLPAVRALNVKCEKNHMTVNIVFDRPFYGMVFSKGHYNDQKCVHLPPNSGQTSVNFDIHLGKCGMSSSDAGSPTGGSNELQRQQQVAPGSGQQPNGVFIENTIIIQYDPLVQEIYDQARKLRCTWYDYYEKSVTFRPYNVDMLDAVTANFLGDNIQCWMQIQVGKGPWSSEVAGIVKIGQTMTMVLAIKDDENRFDMLVRNCVAHDGKHQPIQLVDEYGCVARPKIMGKFQKVRNFGPAATVVSYAHFQAFKFPDSMNVHFQCVIQVCRYECPEPVCQQSAGELAGGGGGGGNSLIGPTGTSGGASSSGGDYATSGTEMIASKELVPHQHNQAGYFNPPSSTGANSSSLHPHLLLGHHHHQQQQHHGSNVNLKLDESQGRVQVKLDTSMMAALGTNGRPTMVAAAPQAQGPLPPHLLYANQQDNTASRAGLPSVGAFNRPVSSLSGVHHQTVGLNAPGRLHPGTSGVLAPQPAVSSVSRSHQAHDQHVASFSPQYPVSQASRRSAAYTSRLGEMPASDDGPSDSGATLDGRETKQAKSQLQHALDQLAPYEAEYPLSLIASPRGFRLGPLSGDPTSGQRLGVHPLHRVKRQDPDKPASDDQKPPLTNENNNSNKRQARNLRAPDSTSVQTHKSIQVVSPDDVAFSLLEPDESQVAFPTSVNADGISRRRLATLSQTSSSSVCFSASRFLWAVLVTLTTLISSIVIVTYVILRQRKQLEAKLSTVYSADTFQPPQGLSFNYHTTPMVSQGTSPQPLIPQQSPSTSSGGYLHLSNSSAAVAALERQLAQQTICSDNNNINIGHKRQQDEVHQRNKYLARLYSQFSPASYWR